MHNSTKKRTRLKRHGSASDKPYLYWLLGTLAFITVSRVCAMIAS